MNITLKIFHHSLWILHWKYFTIFVSCNQESMDNGLGVEAKEWSVQDVKITEWHWLCPKTVTTYWLIFSHIQYEYFSIFDWSVCPCLTPDNYYVNHAGSCFHSNKQKKNWQTRLGVEEILSAQGYQELIKLCQCQSALTSYSQTQPNCLPANLLNIANQWKDN